MLPVNETRTVEAPIARVGQVIEDAMKQDPVFAGATRQGNVFSFSGSYSGLATGSGSMTLTELTPTSTRIDLAAEINIRGGRLAEMAAKGKVNKMIKEGFNDLLKELGQSPPGPDKGLAA